MKILVVVDVQNDFVTGTLGSKEARAIIPNIKEKVNEYSNSADSLIVYTRDTHYSNYFQTMEGKILPIPHCIHETSGWDIVEDVINENSAYAIIDKNTFGKRDIAERILSIVGEAFESFDIESIEIVGLCTDICVIANAILLKTAFSEIPIKVDSKCCAGSNKKMHDAALGVMKSCQIEVD